MPSNTASLPTYSREEFCLALRAVREQKRITLDQIAEVTKIPTSVFAALERGDLRHWPKGLFGRSFFRAYAGMIGVPVDKACAEFVRLFCEDKTDELPKCDTPPPETRAVWLMAKVKSVLAALAPRPASTAPVVREWVTDARRVGPRSSPRTRVRIKIPR